MRSLHIGATGMLAQQTNVEIISNNIANMNTTAYSRRRAEFHDLLYQNMRRVGASSSDSGTIVPAGVQLGLGVKTASVYRISEHGTVLSTDNTLDLAIQGNGYFQIELPGDRGMAIPATAPSSSAPTAIWLLMTAMPFNPASTSPKTLRALRLTVRAKSGSKSTDKRNWSTSVSWKSQTSPTKRAWKPSGTTSLSKPTRRATRTSMCRELWGSAQRCKVSWKTQTSMSCRKSRNWSVLSAPMK